MWMLLALLSWAASFGVVFLSVAVENSDLVLLGPVFVVAGVVFAVLHGKRKRRNANVTQVTSQPSVRKKWGWIAPTFWALIGVLAVIIIVPIASQAFDPENAPKTQDQKNAEILQVTTEQYEEIRSALESCGASQMEELTHDELLDEAHEPGERAYRLRSNGLRIVLYLHKDGSVNLIRHADINLFEGGQAQSKLTDYYTTDDEENEAILRSEEAVKAILKAPSTAKFPNILHWKFGKKDGQIWAQSYVDAQNGFGAMIRSEFQIIYDDDWTITSFILDGEELM